nr:MAG TPA: hypothetical protein [Caudoviricetes sp.]
MSKHKIYSYLNRISISLRNHSQLNYMISY